MALITEIDLELAGHMVRETGPNLVNKVLILGCLRFLGLGGGECRGALF